jgi:hypothetical protein
VHVAVSRDEVEPGRGPLGDRDLDPTESGLRHHRAPAGGADADVAIGRLRDQRGVSALDRDVAVGRLDPQLARDRTHASVAIGALDHRRAVDLTGPHPAGARAELGIAGRPLHADVPDCRAERDGYGVVEVNVAHRCLEPAVAQRPGGAKRRDRRLAGHPRTRGQPDLHRDRPGVAEGAVRPPAPGGPHQQPAGGVLHGRLLRGGHVGPPAWVAGADLDDGVPTIAGGDPNIAHGELDDHGDGFRRVEFRHGRSPSIVRFECVFARVAVR